MNKYTQVYDNSKGLRNKNNYIYNRKTVRKVTTFSLIEVACCLLIHNHRNLLVFLKHNGQNVLQPHRVLKTDEKTKMPESNGA